MTLKSKVIIFISAIVLSIAIIFTSIVIILQNSSSTNKEVTDSGVAIPTVSNDTYSQEYRPQLHFSPSKGYMNDPNGLIYNSKTKEYHLYFQHQPQSLENEGKHIWGHAVSKDLLHWEEKEAVLPYVSDDLPASGSAVIDKNNTSGLFSDDIHPEERMVIIYTSVNYSSDIDMSKEGNQQVGIAYSEDGGYTYKKYTGNPVILNPNNMYDEDFRDPKVMWIDNDDGGTWLMIIGGGRLRLFTSPDLIHWTYNSSISDINGYELYMECPDLFPLNLDGNSSNTKWVLLACGQFYIVGDLQKNAKGRYYFHPEQEQERLFSGASQMNASQSFYNDANNRRILMSWIVDTSAEKLENKNWNGSQSLPVELKLKTVNGKSKLVAECVKEIENIREKELLNLKNKKYSLSDDVDLLQNITGTVYELKTKISWDKSAEFGFRLRKSDNEYTEIRYDSLTGFLHIDLENSSNQLQQIGTAEKINLENGNELDIRIIIDTSIIEIWVNDFYYSSLYFPSKDSVGTEMFLDLGEINVEEFNVWSLSSVWN